jgi:phosphatidylglycerol---prolipoprotein diacylglyceryl transferase
MHQTLFHIASEIGEYQVFGFGLLLALWAVASVVTLVVLARRQGFNADTLGYVPILLVIGAIIAFVLPGICETSADGNPLGLPIRGYGVMMLLAVVSGAVLATWRAKRVGLDPDLVLTLIFWMIVPGIIGARAFHVIEYWRSDYWPRYTEPGGSVGSLLREIVNVAHGGLVVYGSFFGGVLGMLLFVRKYRQPLLALGDLMAPSLLLGVAIGRIGCLLNGCCFGAVCDHAWAIEFPAGSPAYIAQAERGQMHGFKLSDNPDTEPCVVLAVDADSQAGRAGLKAGDRLTEVNEYAVHATGDAHRAVLKALFGKEPLAIRAEGRPPISVPAVDPARRSLPVEPSQPLSTVDALVLCLLLLAYDPFRRRDGELFALMMSVYPITRFLIEMLRSDEAAVRGTGMSIGQCVSLLLLLCAAGLWFYVLRRPVGTAFSRQQALAAAENCEQEGGGVGRKKVKHHR